MLKSPRRKGWQGEHEIVEILTAHGIEAYRIPLSGQVKGDGEYAGDVKIKLFGKSYLAESKRRKDDFKRIYSWLGDKQFLFFRKDRAKWLVAMPIEVFIELATRGGNGDVKKRGNKDVIQDN